MVMLRVNIAEAKAHLSRLLGRLRKGETILICRRNQPVAELRGLGLPRRRRRRLGTLRGWVRLDPDFFGPLPEEVVGSFYRGHPGDPLRPPPPSS